MAALDAAGIYLISDLGEPATSINRADPVWDIDLYTRYTSVVDAMAKYDNVIGFFAGNEVTNNVSYTAASAFVKAAVRDTKAYIASKNYRAMGVGYAADDDATVRASVSSYLNCGDPSTSIDFWGYNIYEWCGDSTYQTSGYAARTAEFQNYNVPVFFAEYGCNTQPGGAATREFTEVAALYGTDMAPVFSGGIVYEYFEEVNDYGLVTIAADASVSTLADFNAWSTQIASVSPSSVQASAYTPTNSAQSCPTVDANWQVSPSGLPPTPNESVCNCEVSTLTCVASSSVTDEQIGDLFSQVCGYNSGKPCVGIATNTTTGTYGAFSMCTSPSITSTRLFSHLPSPNLNILLTIPQAPRLKNSPSHSTPTTPNKAPPTPATSPAPPRSSKPPARPRPAPPSSPRRPRPTQAPRPPAPLPRAARRRATRRVFRARVWGWGTGRLGLMLRRRC